jgi:hypothetical protein
MRAIAEGLEPPRDDSPMARVATVASYDSDLFRSFLEIAQCLALPQDVLRQPGVEEKVESLAAEVEPRPFPWPDRDQLLAILAG